MMTRYCHGVGNPAVNMWTIRRRHHSGGGKPEPGFGGIIVVTEAWLVLMGKPCQCSRDAVVGARRIERRASTFVNCNFLK